MINNSWDLVLKEEYQKPYFKELMAKVNIRYQNSNCFPKYEDIFRALKLTGYKDVKVVILGQDPYHGLGEANGLSFSVNEGIKVPPSLRNIFKELNSDLGITNHSTDFAGWATEGVLLLNSILTVEQDQALSHKDLNWMEFTDCVIKKLNEHEEPIVFILWGNFAISKSKLITNSYHLVLTSAHPSPLSAYHGFFGSKPFSKTNDYLICHGIKPINWQK